MMSLDDADALTALYCIDSCMLTAETVLFSSRLSAPRCLGRHRATADSQNDGGDPTGDPGSEAPSGNGTESAPTGDDLDPCSANEVMLSTVP